MCDAEHFTNVFKRPEHMHAQSAPDSVEYDIINEDDCRGELQFSIEDIHNAANESNFDKSLGLDCFDGNFTPLE